MKEIAKKLIDILKLIKFEKEARKKLAEIGITNKAIQRTISEILWSSRTNIVKFVPEEEWEYRNDRSNILRIDPMPENKGALMEEIKKDSKNILTIHIPKKMYDSLKWHVDEKPGRHKWETIEEAALGAIQYFLLGE